MNRIFMTLAAVCMAMILGACGQKEPKPPEVTTPDATMDQPKAMDESKEQMPADTQENTEQQVPANTRADASDANNPVSDVMQGADQTVDDAAKVADDAAKAAGQAVDSAGKDLSAAADMDDEDDDDDDDDSES